MKLLRTTERPEQKYSLAFVGYDSEDRSAVLELTYNYGVSKYDLGGAWLAAESGAPVVPVAHNAGLVWPRNAFVKRPGTVTVRIGPAIESANRDPQEINGLAEAWIEEQQKLLCP